MGLVHNFAPLFPFRCKIPLFMRLFWLGMHKILVQTELPRLRELGFEVYNPPYKPDPNSGTDHQSAERGWNAEQPTTLPPEVFKKLSSASFFSGPITPDLAELLNRYFDAVIVTIDPHWMAEIAKVYKGKILYRNYGHISSMSDFLWNLGVFSQISERDNFWYIPHAAEAARHEHRWLREREAVVPYVPETSVFRIKDRWQLDKPKRREIMLSCPNLTNPFYKEHFNYLKSHFNDPHYRFYGVQMGKVEDPQISGTLPFDEYLGLYETAAGFLYTYRNPAVCFLPPIEMMIAGGPVIFLQGSLLDQYFHGDAPGRAKDEAEARLKCERLLASDKAFAQEVISSQSEIRKRYFPEFVWPIFDKVFLDLLSPSKTNEGKKILIDERDLAESLDRGRKRLYALTHSYADSIEFKDGKYSTGNGDLTNLKRSLSQILSRSPTVEQVILTASGPQLPKIFGYFEELILGPVNFRILPVDQPGTAAASSSRVIRKLRRLSAKFDRRVPEVKQALNRLGIIGEPVYCRNIRKDPSSLGVLIGKNSKIPEYSYLRTLEYKEE